MGVSKSSSSLLNAEDDDGAAKDEDDEDMEDVKPKAKAKAKAAPKKAAKKEAGDEGEEKKPGWPFPPRTGPAAPGLHAFICSLTLANAHCRLERDTRRRAELSWRSHLRLYWRALFHFTRRCYRLSQEIRGVRAAFVSH